MSTQLQMTNRILRRLRESTVTTVVENSYATLIADFINEAIEEVANAHAWRRYEEEAWVTIQASADSADVSRLVANGGAVEQGKALTPRSTVLVDENTRAPMVLFAPVTFANASTTTNWNILLPRTHAANQKDIRMNVNSADNEYAAWFDLVAPASDKDAVNISVYPRPAQQSTILIYHWTPPTTLAVDGTDNDTEIEAPETPVFRYALMLALNERGEELGEPGNIAEANYFTALAEAIEQDIALKAMTGRFDWRR